MAEVDEDRPGQPGRGARRRHRRRLAARQQRLARQRRHRLRHPEGLGATRGKGEDLLADLSRPAGGARRDARRPRSTVVPPPPIQGLGHAGGFQMQVELQRRQLRLRQAAAGRPDAVVELGNAQPALTRLMTAVPRRSAAAHASRSTARKAETLGVQVGDVFQTRADLSRLDLRQPVHRFGHTFQVYVQADAQFRADAGRRRQAAGAQQPGRQMVPHRHARLACGRRAGPARSITLYNLYPAADDQRRAGAGLQLRRRRWT